MSIQCKKCMDTGYIEYYHDAGDHFGGGSAPDSEWKKFKCDCQQVYGPIKQEINYDNSKAVKEIEKMVNKNKPPRCPACKSTIPLNMYDGILSCEECFFYCTPSYNKGYWTGYYDGLKKENK